MMGNKLCMNYVWKGRGRIVRVYPGPPDLTKSRTFELRFKLAV